LSRLAALYRLLAWISRSHRPAWRELRWYLAVSNKIEFSYLNWNLMVPKLHPLTVAFYGNSAQADNVSSFVRNGDGCVTT
jgi:hypothetical protein